MECLCLSVFKLESRLLLQLAVLSVSNNSISGTLPSSWSGFSQASHAWKCEVMHQYHTILCGKYCTLDERSASNCYASHNHVSCQMKNWYPVVGAVVYSDFEPKHSNRDFTRGVEQHQQSSKPLPLHCWLMLPPFARLATTMVVQNAERQSVCWLLMSNTKVMFYINSCSPW